MAKKTTDLYDYEYEQTLEDHGIFILSDEISSTNTSDAIEFILKANLKKKKDAPKNLTLIVNSPGGEISAAFALIDIMQGSSIPVHTLGLGQVSSAGLLIFMAGKKDCRTLTPNTSILSHQYSWGSHGKEHELIAVIKEFNLTSKRMLNHYMKCTGMSEKKVKEILMPSSDVYLDAAEAVKYNIADKVVDTYLKEDTK
jgi:ATP-dependent Clp protease protease subunit